MKCTDLKQLVQSLQKNPSSLYVILGKDLFLRKEAIVALQKALSQSSETLHLDANKLSDGDLSDALFGISMFCKKRFIIIDQADELSDIQKTSIEKFITQSSPQITLVISADALNANSTFYKSLEKQGVVLSYPEEKAWEKEKSSLTRLQELAGIEKIKVSPQVLQLLIRQVGTDPSELKQEFEKICTYVGEKKEIRESDVLALTKNTSEEDVFKLRDALFSGKAAEAFAIGRKLLQHVDQFIPLVRQLRSQVQVMAHIHSCNRDPNAIGELYPWMKGVILSRNLEMAANYSRERCHAALIAIDQAERRAKDGDPDLILSFDVLLARLLV